MPGEWMAGDFTCRMCGTPSELVLNENQAFCSNDGCRVLMFDPSRPDGGLSNPQYIDLVEAVNYQRPAVAGELCTCGRPAMVIYVSRPDDPVGHCGLENGGRPENGWCPFCENELRHDSAGVDGPIPQGERCPRYRLRLDGPVQPLP